jgi:hypothetical protein
VAHGPAGPTAPDDERAAVHRATARAGRFRASHGDLFLDRYPELYVVAVNGTDFSARRHSFVETVAEIDFAPITL